MNIKTIIIDINNKIYSPIIAKQGDTESRFLIFKIFDKALPFSLINRTIRAYALKPDGTEVYNDLVINDSENGICTLELTNQMLAVAGIVNMELVIMEGTKKLSSIPFELDVIGSINTEDSILSTNEYKALVSALSIVQNIDLKRDKADLVKSSELNTSQDSYKIQPENLSQAVHNIMNGNAPAFTQIGYKQVTTDNLGFLRNYINIFDKESAVADKAIDGLGHLFDQVDYYVTNLIRINANGTYTFRKFSKIEWYDTDKKFIIGNASVSDNTSHTAPENAVYLRGLTYKTVIDQAMIVEGESIGSYSPYKLLASEGIDFSTAYTKTSIKSFLELESSLSLQPKALTTSSLDCIDKSSNLFNKSTAIANRVMDGIGNIFTQVDYYVSDWIPVKPNTYYCRTNHRFQWYDIDKNFISGSTSSPPASYTPILSPSNAYYIRVSFHKNDLDKFMFVEGETYPEVYTNYGYIFNSLVSTPVDFNKYRWYGKKWYVCGDSITENRKYQQPVSNMLKLAGYTTDGNPGKDIAGCTEKIIANPSVLDTYDIVTIFAGTNDFGGAKELGDINSVAGTTTTYGALKLAVETISSQKPLARLVLITPIPRGKFDTQPDYDMANSKGYKLIDYVNAVKKVGELYHIPVLDLYNLSGFNKLNISNFTMDNLHPNDTGNERMYPVIAKFLEQL